MDNLAFFLNERSQRTVVLQNIYSGGHLQSVLAKEELTTLEKTMTLRSTMSTCHVHSRKTIIKLSITSPSAGSSTGTANLIGSYYMCSSCDTGG